MLKIEQTNKEITDLEKSLKNQNVEIGANEIVRTTAIAQKTMEELNQAMIETEIKKETKDAIIESTIKNRIRSPRTTNRKRRIKQSANVWGRRSKCSKSKSRDVVS